MLGDRLALGILDEIEVRLARSAGSVIRESIKVARCTSCWTIKAYLAIVAVNNLVLVAATVDRNSCFLLTGLGTGIGEARSAAVTDDGLPGRHVVATFAPIDLAGARKASFYLKV